MKMISRKILSFLPFLIVFIGSFYTPSDPDLGWHLKYGEFFFKNGRLLRDNTFSVLMPDYKWANTSWGTDLITYAAFNTGGLLALTLLGALVVTLSFYFYSKAARLSLWDQVFLFPLLLFIVTPINSISFRGQQISILLLGIMFYILSLYRKGSKKIFLIIPLFFLWANVHGQFILGLIMLLGWITFYIFQLILTDVIKNNFFESIKASFWENKKDILNLISVIILSILVTLINPFGIGIHRDAIAHIGSPLLKNISEYLPFPSLSQAWWNQVFVAVLLVIGVIYMSIKKKFLIKFPYLASALLLYVLSFSVRRFAWPAYYLVLPILQPVPGFFKPDSKKITDVASAVMLIILFVLVAAGKLPFENYRDYNWEDYCRNEFMKCSPKAAKYVENNKLTNKLYSVYGWGGYLIWNFPMIKPTIDGRMHMWRNEKGYSAFEDYYAVEQNIQDIDKSKYNVALMSPDKPVYKRLVELSNEGKWRLVYSDKFAGVFVKKQ